MWKISTTFAIYLTVKQLLKKTHGQKAQKTHQGT